MTNTDTTDTTHSDTTHTPQLAADDPRMFFARAVQLAGATIAAVRPDQFDDPTPCDDFDVRTLIGHLHTVLDRVSAMGEGGDPMAVPGVTEVADDAVAPAWIERAHRVQAAWTDPAVLDRTMVLPWATAPGRAMLGTYTNELTVHTWDLATATGQQPEWNEDVLAFAYAAIRQALPAGGRVERYHEVMSRMLPAGVPMPPPVYQEAIEVADDRPLLERLLAWTGRRS